MPIRPLLEGEPEAFGSQDIEAIAEAFEQILRALHLADRNDPAVMMIAKLTIELAKEGERDPARLCDAVVRIASIY
jgi:hypothetical protein